jgi:hypothetical protein
VNGTVSLVASLLLLLGIGPAAFADDVCERERGELRYYALQMSCDQVRAAAQAYVSGVECDVLKAWVEETARQAATSLTCDQLRENATARVQQMSCGDLFARSETDCETKRADALRQNREIRCSELRKGIMSEAQQFSCERVRWVMLQNQDAAPCSELRDGLASAVASAECRHLVGIRAAWSTRQSATESLVRLVLPEGLEIKIPKSWSLIVGDHKKEVDAMVQRTLDLSGIVASTGTLISATSTTFAYAEVRVTSETTYSQTAVSRLAPVDISAYDAALHSNLQTMLRNQAVGILEWYGTRRESMGGLTCLISEYRRSPTGGRSVRPAEGPVRAQVVYFPLGSRSISLALSYTDVGNPPTWQATIGQIRASFAVKQK